MARKNVEVIDESAWFKIKALVRAVDNALLACNGGRDAEAVDDAVVLSGMLYELVNGKDGHDEQNQ